MTNETAKVIAAGVGPLIAALIAAYQLWLKPRVDEERATVRDVDRLRQRAAVVRKLRLHVLLFTVLVASVTAIPVVGTIGAALQIDIHAAFALEKVLVVFVAIVGVVHLVYLIGRLRAVHGEVAQVTTLLRNAERAPPASG